MTPTKAEELARELEFHGRHGSETEQQAAARRVERNARAAAELRCLSAVEAERDALRAALLVCIAALERTEHCTEADRLAAAKAARAAMKGTT